jgi:hypothetical protein
VNDGVAGHRYWKFTPLTYASDGGGQVVALDYYDANGVNAMSMATVLASTPANWANALDNNATTGVSISKTGNYYLALDFKAKVDIHKAVIDTPYLNTIYICLASAKIEWSDDGASWTESGRFSRPAVCTGGSYNRIQTVTW